MSRGLWKNRNKIKPKVEDMKLSYRIAIHQQVIKRGSWSKSIDGHLIEINHTSDDEITAFVDGRSIQTWKLYPKPIRGQIWRPVRDEHGNRKTKKNEDGTIKELQRIQPLPPDEAVEYYVISSTTGKRYRFLYIHNRMIATRDDHNARWKRPCLSTRQRKTLQYYEFFGMSKHQKIKWIRRYGFIPEEYDPRLPCKYWHPRPEDMKLLEEIR